MSASLKAAKNRITGSRSKRNFIGSIIAQRGGVSCAIPGGETGMRSRLGIAALLALALFAAPAAHAQQQPRQPAEQPAEAPLPGRVIEGIGGPSPGIFEPIFGKQPPHPEGEIQPPPPEPQ